MAKVNPMISTTITAEFSVIDSDLVDVMEKIKEALDLLQELGSAEATVTIMGDTTFTVR